MDVTLTRVSLFWQYSKSHYIAVLLCVCGISLLVISDIRRDTIENADADAASSALTSTSLYGDFLCLLGSAVYACSNVGQEYLVKKKNRRVRMEIVDWEASAR